MDQQESDLARASALRRVGLEIVEVVHRDLDDRDLVTRRMDEAAERASLLPRRWQLAPDPLDLDALLDRRDATLVE